MADTFGSLAPSPMPSVEPLNMEAVFQELMRRGLVSSPPQMPNITTSPGPFPLPKVSAEYATPLLGGTVGVTGEYERNPFNPRMSDWSARMMYRRQF